MKEKLIRFLEEEDLHTYLFVYDKNKKFSIDDFMLKRLQQGILSFCILTIICLGFSVLHIFSINIIFYLICILTGSVIVYKKDYWILKSKFKSLSREVKDSFPLWMASLEVLIVNNNIPNTIRKSLIGCPKPLRKDLKILTEKLDRDPTDKSAYTDFLKNYNIPEIQEIVLDLYQFNFLEKDNIIIEFRALHKRINRLKSDIRKRRQSSEKFWIGALNSIPLFINSIYILLISNLLSSVLMSKF